MLCCWHSRIMSRRRRDTETSEGRLYIRVVSGAVTYEGLLTVDGELPLESDYLESDHSQCSGLVHCWDKRRERSSTRDKRLRQGIAMARKTRYELWMKSGARMIRTAVDHEYNVVRSFLGLC